MAQQDIDIVLLKGMAYIELYYRNFGLRPMNDIDILIRIKDLSKTLNMLKKIGFEPTDQLWCNFDEEYTYIRHGAGFHHPEMEIDIDLHWHILPENRGIEDDNAIWRRKKEFDIEGGVKCFTLEATDHLLHTCLHGFKWNPIPSLRWIADALMILKHEDIQWQILIDEAKTREMGYTLGKALEYLKREYNASIPVPVVDELMSCPMSRREKIGKHARYSSPDPESLFVRPWRWFHYQCYLYMQAKRYKSIQCIIPSNVIRLLRYHWQKKNSSDVFVKFFRGWLKKIKIYFDT